MNLGTVIGNVVASEHHPAYDSQKLMVVKVENSIEKESSSTVIAFDQLGAGVGDRVLLMQEGNGAGQLFGGRGPVNAVVVGIVDDVHRTSENT